MTVKELREEAKSLGLVGYSKLKKEELIEFIATAKAEVIEMSKECKWRRLAHFKRKENWWKWCWSNFRSKSL